MTRKAPSASGSAKPFVIFFLIVAGIYAGFLFSNGTIRRAVREALMQRVTSAHYEILSPPRALSQDAMTSFATQRENLFQALDKKLGDAASNKEIRIVFDPEFSAPRASSDTVQPPYSVDATTIRTKLIGQRPQLPAAADSEALLYAAWGKPGNPQIARWTANWLVGLWHGAEIGMAAAGVEQRLGHKNVSSLLVDPGGEISSPDDRTLLGTAWISEIAEFGGADAVRKIYSAKMAHPTIAEVAKALGTTPLELDRKWQLWIYAYLAGMPSMQQDSGMPSDMPMGGSH
jgi:hypothetical protein